MALAHAPNRSDLRLPIDEAHGGAGQRSQTERRERNELTAVLRSLIAVRFATTARALRRGLKTLEAN